MIDYLRLADIRDLARKAVRECRATKRNVKVDVPHDAGRMWFVAESVGWVGRVKLSLFRDLIAASESPGGAEFLLEGSEEALAVDIWAIRTERAGPSLDQLARVFA